MAIQALKKEKKSVPVKTVSVKLYEDSEDPVISNDIQPMVASVDTAIEAAYTLENTGQESFYRLGGVLSFISDTKAYRKAGAETFEDFCEGKVDPKYKKFSLGIKPGRAFRFMKIYKFFTLAGVSTEKLSEIGWTKAFEIASTKELEGKEKDIKKLLTDAKKLTVDQLADQIHNEYVSLTPAGEEGEKVKVTTRKFRFFSADLDIVNKAIELVKKDIGITDDAAAISSICATWLMYNGDKASMSIDAAIAELQTRFGVQIIGYTEKNEIGSKKKKEKVKEVEEEFLEEDEIPEKLSEGDSVEDVLTPAEELEDDSDFDFDSEEETEEEEDSLDDDFEEFEQDEFEEEESVEEEETEEEEDFSEVFDEEDL